MDYWINTDRIFSPGDRDSFPLVHMTQDWEVLELILKEGLKPSYCSENITNDKENKGASFPMISLSNITPEFAISYQKSYGTLGIVLDKKWGEENDFNPVLYLERKSDLTNDIISNFKSITAYSTKDLENALNGLTKSVKSIMTKQHIKVFAHSKNYDGILVRNKKLLAEAYPFGMEREWRKIIRNEKVPYFLVGEEMEQKQKFNEIIQNIRVDYKLEHLKAIIVESDWQIKKIESLVCEKYKIEEFPKDIEIILNSARHVYNE